MSLMASLVLSLGCDRNIEPYEAGEEVREPDLARIFPGPPPGAAGQTASGTPDRTALPPSRAEGSRVGQGPAQSASAATASAQPITGRIDLARELATARPDGGVLFIIARSEGATGGPPLAVLRVPSPEFPMEFSIGPENVMIPSMQFAGSISLSARLDADGNAMTRGAGDISSAALAPLTPGTSGVEIVLSERS